MIQIRLIAALLATAGLAASPASAQSLEEAECGARAPLDAAFLDGVAEDGRYVTARLGRGDALVVAEGLGGLGIGVFVRRSGSWRGYGLSGIGGIHAVYQAPDGAVFAWAYNGRGDPPSGYTAFRVGARPGGHFCSEIGPPDELNRSFERPYEPAWRGEYFDFADFNLDAGGTGAIVGSAEVQTAEGAEPETLLYRYASRNGGRTWSAPRRMAEAPPPPGVFARIEAADAALFAELRAAAGR